ncbi:histidine kinase,GAF domain-containing protein [Thermobacillus composti KWC4]|uniref:histidine kinase n=1 Tax=Thermobacillus composti (strain DSM 18247 / JCM 13945 / KWC4) TaxID=717605 RepID=L0EFB0_THECK|nr:GAF domain-containing sensor histidine kinase [Thermobacillus composti]AGA58968.1 histidine kinase,GAF domain-containing protein [Thermobacillus composti KWC4]
MEHRIEELVTLKTIAETLNRSNELMPTLNTVLEKLLELTGLKAGWIFLSDGIGQYELAADAGLPPALEMEDKRHMRCGTCWCLDRFWENRLDKAVNILNCKRLEDAVTHRRGDTGGITHHATVPLTAGEKRLGVLNVAAPGKKHFHQDELALLQSVAFQIGSAIERARLYAAEQRRAELFAKLGEFSRDLGASAPEAPIPACALALMGKYFPWPFAAILRKSGTGFVISAVHAGGETFFPGTLIEPDALPWLKACITRRRRVEAAGAEIAGLTDHPRLRGKLPPLQAALAVPLQTAAWPAGALVVGTDLPVGFRPADGEVLEAIAEHLDAAVESAQLEEQCRELARLDERNRLARDLHDSVCQMLFSLSMTAKGAEQQLHGGDADAALAAVREMQSLSREALKEMRALIMQLRPAGLETGLVTALSEYGRKLGLKVSSRLIGVRELPRQAEEALWRIGQEALNNVSKHAQTDAASVELELGDRAAVLRISDSGVGMRPRPVDRHEASLGLFTMRERAMALGGELKIASDGRKGTLVEAAIPLPEGKEGPR